PGRHGPRRRPRRARAGVPPAPDRSAGGVRLAPLPRAAAGRDRRDARDPGRHGPIAPALRHARAPRCACGGRRARCLRRASRMTDDRSLERAARSWLEIGPTTAPERAVDAALLRIQTLNQERDLRIPWRLPKMVTPARLVAIALVGALVLGGVLFVLGAGGRPSTVLQPPGPTPSTTPSRSASPSSAVVRTEAPVRMKGDWEAVVTAPITPYAAADDAIQWSIDWSEGIGTWLQTSNGDQVMRADSVTAQPGEIHLVSTDGQAGGCSIGDDGRYTWSRSTDGLFLTLTKVEAASPARAAVLARTWVHPLDAVNDGGPGVLGFTNHWLQVTLPSVTLALSRATDASDVHAYSGE